MKRPFKKGDFVIIDDCDAPSAPMVALLTSFSADKGTWKARYLSTARKNCTFCGSAPEYITHVEDFGQRVEIGEDGKWFRCVPTGEPSIATYPDGVRREWQDRTKYVWRRMTDKCAELISGVRALAEKEPRP